MIISKGFLFSTYYSKDQYYQEQIRINSISGYEILGMSKQYVITKRSKNSMEYATDEEKLLFSWLDKIYKKFDLKGTMYEYAIYLTKFGTDKNTGNICIVTADFSNNKIYIYKFRVSNITKDSTIKDINDIVDMNMYNFIFEESTFNKSISYIRICDRNHNIVKYKKPQDNESIILPKISFSVTENNDSFLGYIAAQKYKKEIKKLFYKYYIYLVALPNNLLESSELDIVKDYEYGTVYKDQIAKSEDDSVMYLVSNKKIHVSENTRLSDIKLISFKQITDKNTIEEN